MKRIDARTVELTKVETDILDDIDEEWVEGTSLRTFILDRAAQYGEVVSEEFVAWAVDRG